MTARVTVVIPVLDDNEGLSRCLDALARQDLEEPWRVVVADNGSRQDVTAVTDGDPRVSVVRAAQPGSYAARNTALEGVDSPFVAFTDADCLPATDWLRRGVAALEADADAGAVAGHVEVVTASDRRRTAAELYDLVFGFPQRRYVEDFGFGVTANLFTRREVLGEVGAFDASLRSGGDAEWGQRLTRRSRPVRYDATVVVRHPARRRTRDVLRKTRRVVQGREVLRHRSGGPERPLHRELIRMVRTDLRMTARASHDPRLVRRRDRLRVYGMLALVNATAAAESQRQRRRLRTSEHEHETTCRETTGGRTST